MVDVQLNTRTTSIKQALGITTDAVATDDNQTLTNKTISAVNNTITGLTKTDVGLDQVDNTSDLNKPISTATQAALDLKTNLDITPLTQLNGLDTDYNNDLFSIWDDSASALKKIPIAELKQALNPDGLLRVNSIADLTPYDTGTVYNLASVPGKVYYGCEFLQPIVLDKQIVPPPGAFAAMKGASGFIGGTVDNVTNITYIGAGDPVDYSASAGFAEQYVSFTSAGIPGQERYDVDNLGFPGTPFKWVLLQFVENVNWPSLGRLRGYQVIVQTAVANFAMDQGLEIGNVFYPTAQTVTFAQSQNLSGTAITYTGIIDRLINNECNFAIAATENAIKLDTTATITKAIIKDNIWNGAGSFFDATGDDQDALYVLCRDNPPQQDSVSVAWVGSGAGLNATLNNNDYYLLDVTTTSLTSNLLKRFTLTESVPLSGNFDTLNYIGIETATFNARAFSTLQAAAGGGTAKLAIGVNIAATVIAGGADYTQLEQNGAQTQVIAAGLGLPEAEITLSTNDFVRLYIRRDTGANTTVTNSGTRLIISE